MAIDDEVNVVKEETRAGRSPVLDGLAIDDIMWRVRIEVARRRNGQYNLVKAASGSGDVRPFDSSLPRWKPLVPRFSRTSYDLAEFLAYSDADFVDAAFRTILGRPPDEGGFDYHLRQLQSREASRVVILGGFLSSPEGQASGVRIKGLSLPYLFEKLRRKRLVGPAVGWVVDIGYGFMRAISPIVDWVHALLSLGALARRQVALDRDQAREIEELGRVLNEATEYLQQRLVALKVEFSDRVRTNEFEATKSELKALTAEIRARFPTGDEIRALDPFYAAFEDSFRGDRAIVRARVEPYLAMVREVGAGTSDAPVLDIGCGRGEWLELLRDSGLIGRGIDTNRVFIDGCRALGLDVIEGDAVDTLRAMPDGSVGAITSMHLVEHLAFERVVALLDEAHRVLRPGGLIILETPNPENLLVSQLLFYTDPTHRNPLPPEALRWTVEARGFCDVRIERLFLERNQHIPLPLPVDVPGAEAVNVLIEHLAAAMDYAIVGKRP